MPEELEQKLQREAAAKFPDDPERQRRYVYGTLRKTGWTPQRIARHPQGVVKGTDTRGIRSRKALVVPHVSTEEQARRDANDARLAAEKATAKAAKRKPPPTFEEVAAKSHAQYLRRTEGRVKTRYKK